jgi:hypothetical protein
MTEQEKQDNHAHLLVMQAIEEDCKVNLEEKIEHPPIAISYGEKEYRTRNGVKYYPIPICTYGNFSFIQAPPKSMKTFFVSLLNAVYANTDCPYTGDLKSFRDGRHMIHFDTEQGKWHCQRVFKRVLDMNQGLDANFYHTYALRGLDVASKLEFIEYVMESLHSEGKKVGLVSIDGIADLVSSVNNEESCKEVVDKVMSWTVRYDCHIITVIHSNFGSDKPTGHLGSQLEKKAETQIQLKRNDMTRCIDVECRRSRNTSFKGFSFGLTANLPEVKIPEQF